MILFLEHTEATLLLRPLGEGAKNDIYNEN